MFGSSILPGDRRDHYVAPDDFCGIVRTLVEERRKREIEPTTVYAYSVFWAKMRELSYY